MEHASDPVPPLSSRFLIYGLVDPMTGEVRYVGKSSTGMRRPKEHSKAHALRRAGSTHCANWIRSLIGIGATPAIRILEKCASKDDLSDAERRWIAHGRAAGWPLTNHTDGGDGTPGYRHSEASKDKMRQAAIRQFIDPAARKKVGDQNRGRKPNDETRSRMSASHRGRTASAAAKAKISAANKSRGPRSDETKAKISAANRGRIRSDEIRARMSAAHLNPSEETRRKISDAARGHVVTQEMRAKIGAANRKHWAERKADDKTLALPWSPGSGSSRSPR